jgi:hypothetical protein
MANYTREKRARLNAFRQVPWKKLSITQQEEFRKEFPKPALAHKYGLIKRSHIKFNSNENKYQLI